MIETEYHVKMSYVDRVNENDLFYMFSMHTQANTHTDMHMFYFCVLLIIISVSAVWTSVRVSSM